MAATTSLRCSTKRFQLIGRPPSQSSTRMRCPQGAAQTHAPPDRPQGSKARRQTCRLLRFSRLSRAADADVQKVDGEWQAVSGSLTRQQPSHHSRPCTFRDLIATARAWALEQRRGPAQPCCLAFLAVPGRPEPTAPDPGRRWAAPARVRKSGRAELALIILERGRPRALPRALVEATPGARPRQQRGQGRTPGAPGGLVERAVELWSDVHADPGPAARSRLARRAGLSRGPGTRAAARRGWAAVCRLAEDGILQREGRPRHDPVPRLCARRLPRRPPWRRAAHVPGSWMTEPSADGRHCPPHPQRGTPIAAVRSYTPPAGSVGAGLPDRLRRPSPSACSPGARQRPGSR